MFSDHTYASNSLLTFLTLIIHSTISYCKKMVNNISMVKCRLFVFLESGKSNHELMFRTLSPCPLSEVMYFKQLCSQIVRHVVSRSQLISVSCITQCDRTVLVKIHFKYIQSVSGFMLIILCWFGAVVSAIL